ncbi:multidrug resistance protein fnx1 [Polyplosphaeria fusca]|uniref:Multidrug resistance protein fnx1 n=1 Tax=Polyplosphaeria fusca TaxID=682080 RepID=A0A9P4V6C1_9PLEO|nr:multidrug resistance protein fnx1 [Polyplosphaeria fusca]
MTEASGTHEQHPSETSPLLPHVEQASPIEYASGVVPGEPHVYGGVEEQDGGDTARQISNGDTGTSKHTGMPEVRKRMKYIFPALAIGVFLSAADQTLVVSTYGTIGTELKALSLTSWIATSYFLTLAAFQPVYGKLSDIFGRKECLLFAYIVFGVGAMLCGLAQTMPQLIAARAFAGIGGAGMATMTTIIFSDVIPLRERGAWQSYLNIVFAFGSGVGAPLGGLLADSIGWRWAFVAQGPLCVASIAAVAATLHMPKRDHSHWKEKILKVDFLGAAVLVVAVFGLLFGLDRASNVSWSSPLAIAGLCTTPLFVVFVFVERRVANPFAPLRIILNRSLFACYLCNFFSLASWMSMLFFVPLYWQVQDGLSASRAGLFLLPCIICAVCGSLFGGWFMQRTGKYYWITALAYSNLVVGLAVVLLFAGVVMKSTPVMIVGTCICGICNGTGITTTLIGLIANAAHADQAIATACSYLFRSLGSVFGISMAATAFNQTLRSSLEAALSGDADAAEIAARVRESIAYIRELEPGLREMVKECYGRSTRAALVVSLGMTVGSAVFGWFITEKILES